MILRSPVGAPASRPRRPRRPAREWPGSEYPAREWPAREWPGSGRLGGGRLGGRSRRGCFDGGRPDGGATLVEFVLVLVVLVPLVAAIFQLGLYLYVRNSMSACASEGARFGANADVEPAWAVDDTRQCLLDAGLANHYVDGVEWAGLQEGNPPVVAVRIRSSMSPLGFFGTVHFTVAGHAVREVVRP